jgi:antitoxin Phd
MSEPAQEMPISDARDHLADVVNRAVYSGTVTYLTRRGRRLAAIVPAGRIAADEAEAREEAVAEACRVLWRSVAGTDVTTRAEVRKVIDRLMEEAEDAADVAASDAALAEIEAGAPTVPWETVKRELGL